MQTVLEYYAQFMALSKESPVIGGMVGLWIAGSITWAFRSLPRKAWEALLNQMTVTLTLNNAGSQGNMLHFVAFQKWTAKRQGRVVSRRYAISTTQYQVDGPPDISLGFGLHFFLFKGRLFWYRKIKLDSSGSEAEKYEITVRGLTRNQRIIPEMVEAFHYRENREGTGIVEFERYNWGERFMVPTRLLDTVILNAELKTQLVDIISEFRQAEAWYRQRSLAYKLTFVLEGPPGTGKTSLVRAVAGWLGRDIHTLQLSQLNDANIMKVMRGVKKGSILLVEDFDTNGVVQRRVGLPPPAPHPDFTIEYTVTGLPFARHYERGDYALRTEAEPPHIYEFGNNHVSRLMPTELSDAMTFALMAVQPVTQPTPESAPGSLSLSALLNALDGVLPLDNVIVFMTTNAIKNIDPALLRKGRVDHILHIPYLTDPEIVQYVETMCPEAVLPIDRHFNTIAGCDLQALYLENKWDEQAFIDSIPYTPVPASELPKVMYLKTQAH